LAVPTSSSKRQRNLRAAASVLLGLFAVAVLPAAIGAAEVLGRFELLDAALAIPAGLALAVAALLLARSARRRSERTLGRVGGRRTAILGKALGLLGLGLALAGAIAVGFYQFLERAGD
jgi:hypothetical protein